MPTIATVVSTETTQTPFGKQFNVLHIHVHVCVDGFSLKYRYVRTYHMSAPLSENVYDSI